MNSYFRNKNYSFGIQFRYRMSITYNYYAKSDVVWIEISIDFQIEYLWIDLNMWKIMTYYYLPYTTLTLDKIDEWTNIYNQTDFAIVFRKVIQNKALHLFRSSIKETSVFYFPFNDFQSF